MNKKLDSSQTRVLSVATIIAVIVIVIIFRTFAVAIISACIAAFIFYPIQKWFEKKLKNTTRATTLTIVSSFLLVFVPLLFVLFLSVKQVEIMIADVSQLLNSNREFLNGDVLLSRLNDFLAGLTDGRVQLTMDQVQGAVLNAIKSFSEAFLNIVTSSAGGVFASFTSIIIFIYVYAALLVNGKSVLKMIEKLNPLGKDITKIYMSRAGSMTKSMVVVQVVVAIVQGLLGAISLKIAGLDYFVFFAVILSVLSIIPLGGGILTIPIGFVMLALGNISGGIIVLLTHFIIVSNIDNVLRAKLLSKDLRLHGALTIISVLSGVSLFGFIGLIIGPVLMILAVTTIDMYLDFKQNNKHAT